MITAPQPGYGKCACHGIFPRDAAFPLTIREYFDSSARETLYRPHWPGKGLGADGDARRQSSSLGGGGGGGAVGGGGVVGGGRVALIRDLLKR